MKIAVYIKRVPDSETRVKIAADGKSLDEAGVKFILNPYDEFAVEEALRQKEKAGAGEVVVIALGPPAAQETIRTALAMGADRGGQGDGGAGDRRRRLGRGVFATGRAHHRQGTERAALSRAQRHHGGEKEAARGQTHHARAGSARDRLAHPAPGATGRQDRRRGVRSRGGAGASAARG